MITNVLEQNATWVVHSTMNGQPALIGKLLLVSYLLLSGVQVT